MLQIGKKGVLMVAVLFAFSVLTACGGGGGGGVFILGPITVNGIVVDNSGNPVTGAEVELNNDAAGLVTTGADGKFKFTKVKTPYTLSMKTGTDVMEFQGLSRTDPQLTTSGGMYYATTLAGTVTGPTYPLPSDQGIIMGATNNVFAASNGSADSATGAFSFLLAWSGTSAKKTDLTALLVSHDANGLATGYLQSGTLSGVNLVSGTPQTGLTVALSQSVASANTVLNYAPGVYSTNADGEYLMIKANGAKYYVATGSIPSGTSVLLPSGGGTFLVHGADSNGNSAFRIGTAVLGGATTLDLPSSTILENILPADLATNVSKTPTLSWSPVSGVNVYWVRLKVSPGPGVTYQFFLPGSSTSLTIPDYTVFGVPLAGSTTYSWSVYSVSASGWSTNYLTAPGTGGISELTLYQSSNLTGYQSADTNFTTVP